MKFGGGPQQSFDFFLGTKTNFHFEWKLQLILHLGFSYFCSAHAQLAQYEACSVFAGHGFRLTEYVLSFSALFDVKTCNFHKVVPLSKSFIAFRKRHQNIFEESQNEVKKIRLVWWIGTNVKCIKPHVFNFRQYESN